MNELDRLVLLCLSGPSSAAAACIRRLIFSRNVSECRACFVVSGILESDFPITLVIKLTATVQFQLLSQWVVAVLSEVGSSNLVTVSKANKYDCLCFGDKSWKSLSFVPPFQGNFFQSRLRETLLIQRQSRRGESTVCAYFGLNDE
jgi:hypothetical protein